VDVETRTDGDGHIEGAADRLSADDLDLFAERHPDAPTARLAADWPDESTRQSLPWALVHSLLPGSHALTLHSDALCTIADAPDAESLTPRALGSEVVWLPFAAPGPALARIATEQAPGRAALVAHGGLLIWGDSREELLAALKLLDHLETAGSHLKEIHDLENKADGLSRSAIGRLFREAGDPLTVIKLRDLYNVLENTIDAAEDAAEIIERIAAKGQ